MVARVSILVFDEDMFHASMDATYVNTVLRRKSVETSYSKMTEAEATKMDEEHSRELAEWIQEETISQIREGQEVPESRLTSVRWVLTCKPDHEHPPGRKAKARIVFLGYQHPQVAELNVASPTLSRLGRMLTLQWAAFILAELECADAKPAFLPGDGQKMQEHEDVYARASDEAACANDIPLGSAVKLAKAEYGLGNAPRGWWLSVDRFLTSMGGRKTRTDRRSGEFALKFLEPRMLLQLPTWTISSTLAWLERGLNISRPDFVNVSSGVRGKCRVLACAVSEFKRKWTTLLCSTKQRTRTAEFNPINIDSHRDLGRSLTPAELTNLPVVWGAMQWKVTRTGPQHAAALSQLQSNMSQATLILIKETDSLCPTSS